MKCVLRVMVRFFCLFGLIAVCFTVHSALASQSKPYMKQKQDFEVFLPEINGTGVVLDSDDIPPQEPNIVVAKFLKIEPPQNLTERVARLAHGITVDMPPDYDYYGYEIRRYMQGVGNLKIYTDDTGINVFLEIVKPIT